MRNLAIGEVIRLWISNFILQQLYALIIYYCFIGILFLIVILRTFECVLIWLLKNHALGMISILKIIVSYIHLGIYFLKLQLFIILAFLNRKICRCIRLIMLDLFLLLLYVLRNIFQNIWTYNFGFAIILLSKLFTETIAYCLILFKTIQILFYFLNIYFFPVWIILLQF